MTELTAEQISQIEDLINDGIEEHSVKTLKDDPRKHLGMSEIGNPCYRQLYYKFRWFKFEEYDGRMLRLFKRGHREEERFVGYLEAIGCQVKRFDENGKQFRVSGVMGHYGGSCDGITMTPWLDFPLLLEFKTHNSKSFSEYANKKIYKSHPKHVAQMNSYGWKFNLDYAIYFPENKNDDDIKTSIVKLNKQHGMELEQKAYDIITAKTPPVKISENPSFFECVFCTFKEICHVGEIPQKNCRSCRMSTPVDGAQWHCSRYNSIIPDEWIAKGCDAWGPI